MMKIEKCYLQGGGWVLLFASGDLIESHDLAAKRGRRFATKREAQDRMRDEQAMRDAMAAPSEEE